ncbi:hypothetical protein JIN84_12125 [Luteolibacter yonseiensis]|uniref:Uncharacterized protein n=1 Tax=Luteolibacter yonseiensis TaxID=1144680 RepID=A0A934R771_9BACT|nr:hypothetical protein [Luteolibacter yonseiensis]MBK1816364.1 hypothetical protein [Luteolibacter yonseiensis]
MAKFKMRLKLTGLEIEIEGDRQDANQISKTLNDQLGGLLAPSANLVSPKPQDDKVIDIDAIPSNPTRDGKKKRKPSSNGSSKTATPEDSEAIEFRNDIEKWGSPKQEWSTADKALWFLYITTEQTEHKELSAVAIATSFNKHFRQANTIRASNVSRDFGNFKTKKKPAWVNEDTSKGRSKWFLTEEGIKNAITLVTQARGDSQ